METALQKADMLERINDLPNKMDTLVGREFAPDGAVFSGGDFYIGNVVCSFIIINIAIYTYSFVINYICIC